MAKLPDDEVKLRLSDAIKDVQYLLFSGAGKNDILTGTQNRRGLNHVNELFMMLADPPLAGGQISTGEFKVRE